MKDNRYIGSIVAEAICKELDDCPIDALPWDKAEWQAKQGVFNGRFRDVNEPTRQDYVAAAEHAFLAILGAGYDLKVSK